MEMAKIVSRLLIIVFLCNILKAERNGFSVETTLEREGPPVLPYNAPVQGSRVTAFKSTPYTLSYGNLTLAWENYKIKYNKTFISVTEEQMRFAIFRNKVKSIEQHNLDYHNGLTTYWKDINFFSDQSPEEWLNQRRLKRSVTTQEFYPSSCSLHSAASDMVVPSSIDWREKGYVTNVKDQRDCGACWAFAVTGGLEGQWYKKTKKLINLSEQQLVDCDQNNDGCCGGHTDLAYHWLQDNGGIMAEAHYPYKGQIGKCRFNKTRAVATVAGCRYIEPWDEIELMRAVAEVGSIVVSVHATENFQDYSGGVFQDNTCVGTVTMLNHAVLIVGYGQKWTRERGYDISEDYWIVRNGWGEDWGEGGYIRMARNINNMCGIASEAVYPIAGANTVYQSMLMCAVLSFLSVLLFF